MRAAYKQALFYITSSFSTVNHCTMETQGNASQRGHGDAMRRKKPGDVLSVAGTIQKNPCHP